MEIFPEIRLGLHGQHSEGLQKNYTDFLGSPSAATYHGTWPSWLLHVGPPVPEFPVRTDQQHPVLGFPTQKRGYGTTDRQGTSLLLSPALCGMSWCFIRCWPCPLASLQGTTQAGGGWTWYNNRVLETGKEMNELLTRVSHPRKWWK